MFVSATHGGKTLRLRVTFIRTAAVLCSTKQSALLLSNWRSRTSCALRHAVNISTCSWECLAQPGVCV